MPFVFNIIISVAILPETFSTNLRFTMRTIRRTISGLSGNQYLQCVPFVDGFELLDLSQAHRLYSI